MTRVLVVATSRKTRGGITSVVKAHEMGKQWKEYHCKWIETHRDGPAWRKLWYLVTALIEYITFLPFYDIVHIHIATLQSAKRKNLFFMLAKAMGKKVIFHFHPANEKFLFDKKVASLYRKLFDSSDKLLVLSEQWIRWLKESIGQGPWMDKVEVLYNPCPIVNRTNVKRKKQILYAGTLIHRKGYDVLLKAFGKIAKKYPDWVVAFAGNPYLKEGINELEEGKKIAKELDIENQVVWLGWINGDEKERVFNESSIYCLASEGEGFPMGVLDAWSYGIPCVMTPVGGIPDIVRDGIEGLVFPVGDVNALANALERMITSDALRKRIVESADEYVNGAFSVEVVNRKLGDIYQSLCLKS